MANVDLSIICACYNEGPTLEKSVNQIVRVLEKINKKSDNRLQTTFVKSFPHNHVSAFFDIIDKNWNIITTYFKINVKISANCAFGCFDSVCDCFASALV